ncbi:hypothetical protein B7R21_13660 [Subtercola boreus]|uniref:Uncharacterized protein n=2 Tax=Subtercola boreus TaxID=120213 RepID=A0A3E0VC88_9MICO|nr:hypothetical protein B7R21_13660 [Subtercola boreus]
MVSGQDDSSSGDGQLMGILAERHPDTGVVDVTLTFYQGHAARSSATPSAKVIAELAAHSG